MFKIKHARTADVVAIGYRIHKSGEGVGSLLVGLYGEDGELLPGRRRRGAGATSAASSSSTSSRRSSSATKTGAVTGEGEKSRFAPPGRDSSFVRLRPERVLEVRYDQLEGWRFRHTVQFERWRPDRDPESCTYDQLESVSAYDLGDVLRLSSPGHGGRARAAVASRRSADAGESSAGWVFRRTLGIGDAPRGRRSTFRRALRAASAVVVASVLLSQSGVHAPTTRPIPSPICTPTSWRPSTPWMSTAIVRAVLVSRSGENILELWRGDHAHDYVNVQSVTKSVVSILIGIAIDRG